MSLTPTRTLHLTDEMKCKIRYAIAEAHKAAREDRNYTVTVSETGSDEFDRLAIKVYYTRNRNRIVLAVSEGDRNWLVCYKGEIEVSGCDNNSEHVSEDPTIPEKIDLKLRWDNRGAQVVPVGNPATQSFATA